MAQFAESTASFPQLDDPLQLLRAVTESTADGLFVKDASGRYLFCNSAGSKIAGKPVDSVIGQDDTFLFGEDLAAVIRDQDLRVMATRKTESREHIIQLAEGVRTFEVIKSPYVDRAGVVIGVVGVSRDITVKKDAELTLLRQQAVLERIAQGVALEEILNDLVLRIEEEIPGVLGSFLLMERDGKHLRVAAGRSLPQAYNDAVDGLEIGPAVGSCGTAAFLGQRVLVSDIATDPLWVNFRAVALKHGLRACWSVPLKSRQNNDQKVLGTFAVYSRQSGPPDVRLDRLIARTEYLACIAIESSRTLQNLKESESRFRTFVDNSHEAFLLHRHDGVIVDVNNQACEHLGYTREELIGVLPSLFDTTLTAERLKGLMEKLFQGERITFETVLRRKDGSLLPAEVSVSPFIVENVQFAVATVHDISERKQVEDRLRGQQKLLEDAEGLAHLGSFEWQIATNVLTWSDELYRIYGYAPREVELSFERVMSHIHPDDVQLFQETIALACRTGHSFRLEERIVRRDGVERVLESQGEVILDNEGVPVRIIGACLDVTDRKRAKQELDEKQRFSEAILHATPECIKVVDRSGTVVNMNAAGLAMIQADCLERVLGRSVFDLVDEADRPVYRAFHERVCEGESLTLEFDVVGLHGQRRTLESHAVPVDINGKRAHLAVSRDVTDKKRLEEQFRQSQKLEAVGRLAGGVAHDFNNLLMVINGNAEAILTDDLPVAILRESAQAILHAGERAAGLTAQLLAFSRKAIIEPKILNLNQLLETTLRFLRRLIREDILVRIVSDPSLALIKADPGQIEQVVMNLVVNARDAMPNGGRLTLQTSNLTLKAGEVAEFDDLKPGPYVCLEIADTGEGMNEDVLSKIFEPFYTTKEVGKGTGLGLAVVHGVMKQCGGYVGAKSQVGVGTTFTLLFPSVADPVTSSRPESPKAVRRGNETVLLVEDEPAVRKIAQIALEGAGLKVLTASDGMVALGVIDEYVGVIHLLVTDVVMPGMGGTQLVEAVRKKRPEIRVLFMSGHTEDSVVPRELYAGTVAFLQKPFTPLHLARKVRAVLDETGAD